MTFLQDFKRGLSAYGKAIHLITTHQLYLYFIVPVFLNLLLFIGGMQLINGLTDWLMESVFLQLDSWLGELSWVTYVKQVLHVLMWIALKLIYFVLFAFFGGFVVLIFMSPLLAWLSEKTEKIMTGKIQPFHFTQLVKDVFRGSYIALRNLIVQLLFTLLFFLLSFVPVINLAVPAGLFLVSCYFYGFSFMDYFNERQKRPLKEGIRFIRKHKGMAIANGLVFSLFLLVPYIGVFLASVVSIVSVIAATISSLHTEN